MPSTPGNEEDEWVFVHLRDPYHRVDTYETSRRVTVTVDGTVIARSTRAKAFARNGVPVRWYFSSGDVRLDLLVGSSTVTGSAYRGTAVCYADG